MPTPTQVFRVLTKNSIEVLDFTSQMVKQNLAFFGPATVCLATLPTTSIPYLNKARYTL